MDSPLTLLLVALLAFALGAAVALLALVARGRRPADDGALAALVARTEEQAVLRDGLDRLDSTVRELTDQRVSWQSQLRQQVEDVRHSTDALRRETTSLSTALRKPQVRGRWGELHLRRTVEAAGMSAHCDFDEQSTLGEGGPGALRPDLVVHLAGDKHVVVDSKVPLDAFLDATTAEDPEESEAHLRRHARQLRTHTDQLSAKSYWRSLDGTPEFVVLFVPGESFLAAALETDPGLLEHAADRQVVLATPTTLIALLRTVAHAWTQETLAERAREIHGLGRELHERLATVGGHLDKLGRSLGASVGAYNSAVGSLETRVLVSARRLSELGVTDDELPSPRVLDDAPRPLAARELLEAVAEERDELPSLRRVTPPEDLDVPTVGA